MPHIVSTMLAGSPGRTFSDILNRLLLEQNDPVIHDDILWALESATDEGQPFLNGRFASELGRIALAPSSTGRMTTVEALRPHAGTGIPAILLALSHVQALHLFGLAARLTHSDLLAGSDQAPWTGATIAYLGSAAKLAIRSLDAITKQGPGSDAVDSRFIEIDAEISRIRQATNAIVFAASHAQTMTEAVLRASSRLLSRMPFDLKGVGSMQAVWSERLERQEQSLSEGHGVQPSATFWLEASRNIACWTPSTADSRNAWAHLEAEASCIDYAPRAPSSSPREGSSEQTLEIVSGWANICEILGVSNSQTMKELLRKYAQKSSTTAIRLGRKGKHPTANRADLERERDQIRDCLNEKENSKDQEKLESQGKVAKTYASRRPGQSVPEVAGTIKRRV